MGFFWKNFERKKVWDWWSICFLTACENCYTRMLFENCYLDEKVLALSSSAIPGKAFNGGWYVNRDSLQCKRFCPEHQSCNRVFHVWTMFAVLWLRAIIMRAVVSRKGYLFRCDNLKVLTTGVDCERLWLSHTSYIRHWTDKATGTAIFMTALATTLAACYHFTLVQTVPMLMD